MMTRIFELLSVARRSSAVPLLLLGVLLPSLGVAAEPGAGALFIQVKTARLRVEPKHWSPSGAALSFGAAIEEISREGDWLKVKGPGGEEGFLHSSAVTSRTIVFKGNVGESVARTEPNDVVLAGKGFADQLETVFRSGEPGLDYATVDRLEQRVVDGESLEKFLREGKLRVGVVERGARG